MARKKSKQHYDFVFSLGQACSCSSSLRAAKLQYASYPFDWLYGSDITGRADILANGFQGWLDRNDLVYQGDRHHPQPCHIYKHAETGIIFNHDFPLSQTLDESWESVNEKYNRRIDRLFREIGKSKKVLAVYMESPEKGRITSDEMLIDAQKRMAGKFPDVQIDLLYLYCDGNLAPEAMKITDLNEYVKTAAFDYSDHAPNTPAFAVDTARAGVLLKRYCASDRRTIAEKLKHERARLKRYGKGSVFRQIFNKLCFKLMRRLENRLRKEGVIS